MKSKLSLEMLALDQAEVIEKQAIMLRKLVDELAQYRTVETEEQQLEELQARIPTALQGTRKGES